MHETSCESLEDCLFILQKNHHWKTNQCGYNATYLCFSLHYTLAYTIAYNTTYLYCGYYIPISAYTIHDKSLAENKYRIDIAGVIDEYRDPILGIRARRVGPYPKAWTKNQTCKGKSYVICITKSAFVLDESQFSFDFSAIKSLIFWPQTHSPKLRGGETQESQKLLF